MDRPPNRSVHPDNSLLSIVIYASPEILGALIYRIFIGTHGRVDRVVDRPPNRSVHPDNSLLSTAIYKYK